MLCGALIPENIEEKESRLLSLSPPIPVNDLGGLREGSGRAKGVDEVVPPMLGVLSRSSAPSTQFPTTPLVRSMPDCTLAALSFQDDGRPASASLVTTGDFDEGGGIDMLALPMAPSTMPISAYRPFRLAIDDADEEDNKVCEDVLDLMPVGNPSWTISDGERRSAISISPAEESTAAIDSRQFRPNDYNIVSTWSFIRWIQIAQTMAPDSG